MIVSAEKLLCSSKTLEKMNLRWKEFFAVHCIVKLIENTPEFQSNRMMKPCRCVTLFSGPYLS